MFVTNRGSTDFCGGSLISNNYVLTAAHCVDEAISLKIVFGAHNIVNDSEETQVRMTSTNFIVHEQWERGQFENDIALVKLPTPIKETKAIKIIPVANGNQLYCNRSGFVAGWGITKTDQTDVNPLLRFIKSSIMNNNDCKKVDEDYESVITEKLLCLSPGSAKQGTCLGDSGGPLAINKIQVGLVSFGPTDCENGKPSVFTRVTQYLKWIAKHSDVKF